MRIVAALAVEDLPDAADAARRERVPLGPVPTAT
jgi:hypothetical protein